MKMCVQTPSGATYAKTQVLTMLLCALDKKKKISIPVLLNLELQATNSKAKRKGKHIALFKLIIIKKRNKTRIYTA